MRNAQAGHDTLHVGGLVNVETTIIVTIHHHTKKLLDWTKFFHFEGFSHFAEGRLVKGRIIVKNCHIIDV
jgi:hypothetical protein